MHATLILRRCLSSVLDSMHAARSRRLLGAVEALVHGRRLTLTDLSRSWPDANWAHAPLKALDRLLSNPRLHQAIVPLHQAMVNWLIRQVYPIVLVDWSDLKGDQRWCVLRAAVPVGGRALTVYERIFPLCRLGQPLAPVEFLRDLKRLLPVAVRPILVTDAGFRSDWFRAARSLGWHFIGRLRNNTQVRAADTETWMPCASLHHRATHRARELGDYQIVRGQPMAARLALVRQRRKGRGRRARSAPLPRGTKERKCRKSAHEPWLLVTSIPAKERSASQLVAAYAKRMQIEEAFRDLKSHRYGAAFEDCLTRRCERLAVLLLLHTLACFAAWLMSLATTASVQPDPLTRQRRHRPRYSQQRRGMEWLRRRRLSPDIRAALTARNLAELLGNTDEID
jgi:hypothetical protein